MPSTTRRPTGAPRPGWPPDPFMDPASVALGKRVEKPGRPQPRRFHFCSEWLPDARWRCERTVRAGLRNQSDGKPTGWLRRLGGYVGRYRREVLLAFGAA